MHVSRSSSPPTASITYMLGLRVSRQEDPGLRGHSEKTRISIRYDCGISASVPTSLSDGMMGEWEKATLRFCQRSTSVRAHSVEIVILAESHRAWSGRKKRGDTFPNPTHFLVPWHRFCDICRLWNQPRRAREQTKDAQRISFATTMVFLARMTTQE